MGITISSGYITVFCFRTAKLQVLSARNTERRVGLKLWQQIFPFSEILSVNKGDLRQNDSPDAGGTGFVR